MLKKRLISFKRIILRREVAFPVAWRLHPISSFIFNILPSAFETLSFNISIWLTFYSRDIWVLLDTIMLILACFYFRSFSSSHMCQVLRPFMASFGQWDSRKRGSLIMYAKLVHGEDRNNSVVMVRFYLLYRIIWRKVLTIFAFHLCIFCRLWNLYEIPKS